MAILKKEYELSIWNEQLNSDGVKTEKKGLIIGAHDMSHLGRATNIKLKREIKGTNTLTFDMPQKYFDSFVGDYVKNEFIEELYNEQKLKLKYEGKWFEFYIKSINEQKQYKSIMKSFTCQDSFIDELSRTGYEILIDEELYNSVDEITPFMEEILEDSIWDYRADFNWGDFTEFKEERFYKIPLSQFGGSIKGYPIKLSVDAAAMKSNEFKGLTDEEKIDKLTLTNIHTNDKRQIELGDDLAHQYNIYWNPHQSSNGFDLLGGAEVLEGDYIYVAYSDLSFIYGSIYEDPYKSTEEPATYGAYGDKDRGFALQPTSKDPTDFIQFIFFKNNEEVLIDEAGTIANNNCHYLISIKEWNDTLKEIFLKKQEGQDEQKPKAVIHWTSAILEGNTSTITRTEKYLVYEDKENNVLYTSNAMPNSSTIDDFTWYPVYYEDYLSEINGEEVFAARKISITDRTEFNLKNEYYTTIYKNNWDEYKDLYSEDITMFLDETGKSKEEYKDFRVQSMEETRIVVPTLARNLVQNGTEITTSDGWEGLTQNNQTEYNTGSYANLIEVNVKSTTQEVDVEIYEASGNESDENISDYYLEILSPNIEKTSDLDLEGMVSSDYALNFGLTKLENGIEKDKIYAIRLCTGDWFTTGYTLMARNPNLENNVVNDNANEEELEKYKEDIKIYYEGLRTTDLSELTIDSQLSDFEVVLNSIINSLPSGNGNNISIQKEYYDQENDNTIYPDTYYLIHRVYQALIDQETAEEKEDITSMPEEYKNYELAENGYSEWQAVYTFSNQIFLKNYNKHLDKIIIGQGSVDINGNYELSGTNESDDKENFISFENIFDENLTFVGIGEDAATNVLKETYYHTAMILDGKDMWNWSTNEGQSLSVPDNAFLLFKAHSNIKNPYVGIRSDSEPMQMDILSTTTVNYVETDYSGVKVDIKAIKEDDGLAYYVENASVKFYALNGENFSKSFLNSIGIVAETEDTETEEDTEKEEDTESETETSTETDDADKDVSDKEEESTEELTVGHKFNSGDLLSTAKPAWSMKSTTELPLFFSSIELNLEQEPVKYAMFINDVYYGVLELEKKNEQKDEEEETEDDSDEISSDEEASENVGKEVVNNE